MSNFIFNNRFARDSTGERIGKVAHFAMVLAVLVLGGSAWVSYHNIRQLIEKEQWVDHTHSVLVQLETILATATEAVTVERGYLLSDDQTVLPTFKAAQASLAQQIKTLRDFTSDNPRQQQHISDLSAQIDSEFVILNSALAVRRPSVRRT